VYTCCPHCETVHALDADALARGRGYVQCGRCRQEFNALAHLSDERPLQQGEAPYHPVRSSLPVLGNPEALAVDLDWVGGRDEEPPARHGGLRRTWRVLLAILVPITLVNMAWVFRDTILEWPAASAFALRHGLPGVVDPASYRDPTLIHLVSRDFHSHPSRKGVLVLSATFVNLAPRAQPYPELSVTLLDADNRPLANRSFEPGEYLLAGVDPGTGMNPGVRTPLLLEFVDPGEHAVGFQLDFH